MKTELLKNDLAFKLPSNISFGNADFINVNAGVGKSNQVSGNDQPFWNISPKILAGDQFHSINIILITNYPLHTRRKLERT